MSFIAIDAKADVANSKKGKLTPAQHAQLNAWCLAGKTGILDWGDKCVSTAASYSVSDGAATVIFKKGYLVICGRLVECEANTQVAVSAPISGSVNGKIILRYNLSNSGNDEFVVTTTTSALTQQDLNDNPLTGVYEFELYSYTATPSTVTLLRTNTDYIPDIGGKLQQFITVLTGTGMTGTGNPPLQDYDKGKGTIEARLTALGFREADISVAGISNALHLKRQGNYVYAYGSFQSDVASSSWAVNETIFQLPTNFLPPSSVYFTPIVARILASQNDVLEGLLVSITSSGDGVVVSRSATISSHGTQDWQVYIRFGYEANPIT